jgi:GNAT superfamily N-acetyltransferase
MKIEAIPSSKTWALRQSVLRPHQTLSEMQYPGDEDESSRHFGAWEDKTLLGIASLYKEALPEIPGTLGWRLRGMAVAPERRGQGIGAQLVEACIAYARKEGGRVLWCNAREGALPFYLGLKFRSLKGPYDLPGIGPHFLLVLDL